MRARVAGLSDRVQRSAYAFPLAALAAALMLIISELAYHGAESQLRTLMAMGRARIELLSVARRITDAESAQRGYMLTSRADYLTPYRSARQSALDGLVTLQQAYQRLGSFEAEARRQQLAQAVDTKLSELDEVLLLFDSGRKDAAAELMLTGIGRDQMELIRHHVDALLAEENRRIGAGVRDVFDTLLLNRIGVAAMTVISLLALAMFLRQSRLLDLQRAGQQAQILAERDRLEAEVLRRTTELTELARHLQTAREDERARLARDLHDELGALLTAAKLDVARIRPKLQQSAPDLMPRLTHLTEALNSGIALKRRIIEDLRPSTLDNLGLVPALEILCGEVGERLGVPVQVRLEPVSLTPSAQLTLFRLVQEALNNIAKYARATTVGVTLAEEGGQARIQVRDDGVGFDPGQVERATHGLLGMRYRVEAERGQLRVHSAPGQGTTVSACLPLKPAASPGQSSQ
ncbi:signal transduction histidine kinase [Sphaerotilus hippei]|uniref:Signal transduction histidine kinase n=1 Tax=Sphaerotilus hippei TaxID=744406 RepID=A0A318H633_9BURK|nr:CHASE3 domain-containing protein [Sphaerotilus hippei]PXW99427.1 signal transduction histidine kinase [Sphaerotilus hippei]